MPAWQRGIPKLVAAAHMRDRGVNVAQLTVSCEGEAAEGCRGSWRVERNEQVDASYARAGQQHAAVVARTRRCLHLYRLDVHCRR